MEEYSGCDGGEIAEIEIPRAEQIAIAVPHFLLELDDVVKMLEVHTGKGVAQRIVLPVGQLGRLAYHAPFSHPVARCNEGIVCSFMDAQPIGSPSERYCTGSSCFTVLGLHVDNVFLLIDVPPAESLHLVRADSAPEHKPYGCFHTLEPAYAAGAKKTANLPEVQNLNAFLVDGVGGNTVRRIAVAPALAYTKGENAVEYTMRLAKNMVAVPELAL